MSGSPPSAPSGVPTPRPEDPTAPATADKRTLLIASVVMVALVLVGVVSAALFTGTACGSIEPDPVAAGAVGAGLADVDAVLDVAFPDLDDTTRGDMVDALRGLEEQLGRLAGIAEVTGAQALAETDVGFAALGPVTTMLDPQGAAVLARADLGDGRVVGSEDTLYALAMVNQLTGQVDAFLPLDGELEGGACVDTATIGTPLAFHLDAGGGRLLLLRVEEDGSEPELELRDPTEGRVWGTPIEVGVAPPGVLGERLAGRLAPELAVAGRRTAPGDQAPVLTAVGRTDGELRWTVTRDELEGLLASDAAQHVDVMAADDELVVVVLRPDPDEEAAQEDDAEGEASAADATGGRLVALAAADGSRVWDASYDPSETIREVVVRAGGAWVLVATGQGSLRLEERGPDGGEGRSATSSGTRGRVAVLGEHRTVTVGDGAVVVDDGDLGARSSELVGRDVLRHQGGVTLLLEGHGDSSGDGSVAVTFTP